MINPLCLFLAPSTTALCAGDTALRCLVDHLQRQLHCLAQRTPHNLLPAEDGSTRKGSKARLPKDAAGNASLDGAHAPVVCRAATLVIVLTEVLFGASSAWQGSWGLQAQAVGISQAGGPCVEALVQSLAGEQVITVTC